MNVTALLSQWRHRFEDGKMESRFHQALTWGHVSRRRCSRKALPEGSAWSRTRRKTKKRRTTFRCGGVVQERGGGGLAGAGGWRSGSLFLCQKAGCVSPLPLFRACFHVFQSRTGLLKK